MAMCALCGKIVPKECPKCSYPDHKIEAKFNKHDGKNPTKRGSGDQDGGYRWPKFRKGTKPVAGQDVDLG